VRVSKPTHRSGDDWTIGKEQQYPGDDIIHIHQAPSRTILNLIVAFPCAGDGHCATALEYRRVLQKVHKMRDSRGRQTTSRKRQWVRRKIGEGIFESERQCLLRTRLGRCFFGGRQSQFLFSREASWSSWVISAIGLAIALRAARDGANIAIAAKTATPHPKLPGTIHTAAEEIEKAGGRAQLSELLRPSSAQIRRSIRGVELRGG
jgi:hypothetical protein